MATEEDRERMGLSQEDEFNPLSEEELREREEAEEFRRRVRREILRVQSGEADEDIARDREQEAEEQREREEAEQRTARKRSRLSSGRYSRATFWLTAAWRRTTAILPP